MVEATLNGYLFVLALQRWLLLVFLSWWAFYCGATKEDSVISSVTGRFFSSKAFSVVTISRLSFGGASYEEIGLTGLY